MMKHLLRSWLGINDDMQAIAADINLLANRSDDQALSTYKIFHALPFVSGVMTLTAQEAARLTHPNGIQANSPAAIFTGIVMAARQGESQIQISGELPPAARELLILRGFQVEEHEGSDGKSTFIIWT